MAGHSRGGTPVHDVSRQWAIQHWMAPHTQLLEGALMHVDLYTKSILTIIAVCLLVLVFRKHLIVPPLAAQRAFTCHGDMTANQYGGTRAKVGGYQFVVSCP